jgi:hypothetical protein
VWEVVAVKKTIDLLPARNNSSTQEVKYKRGVVPALEKRGEMLDAADKLHVYIIIT